MIARAGAYPRVSAAGQAHPVDWGDGYRCMDVTAARPRLSPLSVVDLRDRVLRLRHGHSSARLDRQVVLRGGAAPNGVGETDELV